MCRRDFLEPGQPALLVPSTLLGVSALPSSAAVASKAEEKEGSPEGSLGEAASAGEDRGAGARQAISALVCRAVGGVAALLLPAGLPTACCCPASL